MEETAIVGLWCFDILMVCALVVLAWRLSTTPDLFQAIVLFIIFGLLMAVVWVRLRAPDIALAEAAIGAGLSGALFLSALGRMTRDTRKPSEREVTELSALKEVAEKGKRGVSIGPVLLLGFVLVLTVYLGWVIFSITGQGPGLSARIFSELPNSGVGNPVTAVLLNFRGYDTLLEVAVMLLGVLAVWSLGASERARGQMLSDPILQASARLLAPVAIVVAGYLLWSGEDSPGGAFQAGAVLAMGGILLLLGEVRIRHLPLGWGLRSVLVAGPVIFLGTGVSAMALGGRFLEYPRDWAGTLILLVEFAAAISIAAILLSLFVGTKPRKKTPSETE